MGDPLLALHDSLADARLLTLLPVELQVTRTEVLDTPDPVTKARVVRIPTGEVRTRRPYSEELDVWMFSQVWGSTALGFGGVGGQAMTSAYTVVIRGPHSDYAVYFSGRLAYHIQIPTERFFEDMANHRMLSVRDSGVYRKKPNTTAAPL